MRYFDRAVDLDGDGTPEILVYVVGPMACGTGGCNLLVFVPHRGGYRLVSSISVVQTPVRASNRRSTGWRDLIVRVRGGGARGGDVVLSFDGKSYPANPTVHGTHVESAAAADAPILIDEFASMNEGKLLPAASAPGNMAAEARPSVDCARAANQAERLVCSDASLAALDRKLAESYGKGLSPTSAWGEPDRKASRERQRAWLGERNACAKQPDVRGCVASAYQGRLAELQIRNGEVVAPTPVGYRCQGIEGRPVFAAFYNQTEPPSAVLSVGDRQVVAFIARSGSGAKYTAKGVEFWEHTGRPR